MGFRHVERQTDSVVIGDDAVQTDSPPKCTSDDKAEERGMKEDMQVGDGCLWLQVENM